MKPNLMNADELKTDYVELVGPKTTSATHIHYMDESEDKLRAHLNENMDSRSIIFDHAEVLRDYWEHAWYEVGHAVGGKVSYWPCNRVDDLASAAMLMREHAPGVAFVAFRGAEELFEVAGIRLVASRQNSDPRITEESAGLRLASAFVCCGQLPPFGVALEASSFSGPWVVDRRIVDAIRRSVKLLDAKVSDSLEKLSPAEPDEVSSPKM